MMATMMRIRDLDFDALAGEVARRVDRASRASADGLINNDLAWITSPATAVLRMRNHILMAALRHARTLDDVRFERPLVQALVRIQRHALADALPEAPVQHGIEGPDAAPRLAAIVDAHPALSWDPDEVLALIIRELREQHGDHALDDAQPPHLMHWGPGSAAAYAFRLFVTLRALGEI
jgi:hypothetical protein